MGGWYNSIHVRSESIEPVRNVLRGLTRDKKYKFLLSPVINGWVGIFAQMQPRVQISTKIAKKLPLDIIELAVYDDDVFCYWYFREGKLIDSFNSCPDYFGQPISKKYADSLKGHPEVFSDILSDDEKLVQLRQIITEVSTPPRLDEIYPPDVRQKITELGTISEKMDHLAKNTEKISEFISANPQLFDDHSEMFRKLFEKGEITSVEDTIKFFLKDDRGKEFIQKILEQYVEHTGLSVELDSSYKNLPEVGTPDSSFFEKSSTEDVIQEMPFPVVFVSEYMLRFADLFGIQNSLTSYEYLQQGDTDDISRWDEFIEIP
jgi:hypothetical protein